MRPAVADVKHADDLHEVAKKHRKSTPRSRTAPMSTPPIDRTASLAHAVGDDSAQAEAYVPVENDQADPFEFDPFKIDIAFIENTPDADGILNCSTDDNCGSSCPSACTTSG